MCCIRFKPRFGTSKPHRVMAGQMNTAIVACGTLRDELEASCAFTGCTYPVHWIESGLHNYPDKLRERLQAVFDSLDGVERVLFAFGFCGNAVAGLQTRGFEAILPRVDDCISLVLGSTQARSRIQHTCFLTRGWLRGERTICDEYQYMIHKYGEETGREIFSVMPANYRYLGVIDTGCYALSDIEGTTEKIARTLGLEQKRLSGTKAYLCDLLTGPWPEGRFLVIPTDCTLHRDLLLMQ